jgi:Ca-activated chloride channel family protein
MEKGNPQIERMWAWHRVQSLLNEARRLGSDAAVAADVVRLCEDYSIASEYASFIVLENDAEYQRWKIDRKNAGRMQRDRGARRELQARLARLREEALAQLGPEADPSQADAESKREAESFVTANVPDAAPMPGSTTPTDLNLRAPRPQVSSSPTTSSGDGGGGFGGGAIDPISGLIGLALAGAAALAARRGK